MITINSASNSAAPTSPKIGLAMAGGGPLGAIYAFGALRALEESLEEVQANALDTYVGVSSGAFLAANLANGYGTEQLYRIFIESNSARHRFRPTMFYQPASREYLRRVAAIPKLFLNTASSALRSPLKFKTFRSNRTPHTTGASRHVRQRGFERISDCTVFRAG